MHTAFADVVLVTAANAHWHADDAELRIPKAERDGAKCPLRAALDVAVALDQVLAVSRYGYFRAASAIQLRLEDVAADVAHSGRVEHPFSRPLAGRPERLGLAVAQRGGSATVGTSALRSLPPMGGTLVAWRHHVYP